MKVEVVVLGSLAQTVRTVQFVDVTEATLKKLNRAGTDVRTDAPGTNWSLWSLV